MATRTNRWATVGAGVIVVGCLLSAAAVAGTAAALVGANDSRCFTRLYSPAHLQEHLRQRIIEATMLIVGDNISGPQAENMALRLQLRRPPEVAEQFGRCDPHGDGYLCYFDGDAGEFIIHRLADRRLRLTIKRLSYESATRAADLETGKGADDTITLAPAEAAACAGLELPPSANNEGL